MSSLELLLAIIGIALTTLVTRASLLLVGNRLRLSPRIEAGLRYAPACALAALLLPALLFDDGTLQLELTNPKLPGALAGAIALLATRSILACISVGTLTFVLCRLAFG
jgi:branched-subunit amino acid transport protein